MFPPVCPSWNSPEFRAAEIPVANGIGTARALATIYGELAMDGGRLVSHDTAASLRVEHVSGTDAVLGIDVRRSLGFELPSADASDGRPPDTFGHPGASGFLAFADPRTRTSDSHTSRTPAGTASPGPTLEPPRSSKPSTTASECAGVANDALGSEVGLPV